MIPNATRQLTAKGVDSKGNTVPATVAWSVVAGGGAIDGVTGLFTAGATAGTFTNTVLATSGQITAYATMTVHRRGAVERGVSEVVDEIELDIQSRTRANTLGPHGVRAA